MSNKKVVTKELEKPYWLKPPWMILFDLVKIQKVRPWEVNLSYILATLIREMEKSGYLDLKASGVAVLSASTIYRMKSDLILELQEPPKPPIEKPQEFVPPPIQIPYRFEYTSTTIDNLIKSLEEAIKTEAFVELEQKLTPVLPAPQIIHEFDQFMIDIENRIEELYQKILGYVKKEKRITLSKLTSGLKKFEAIRIFLLVLFIASKEK
ncbi:MAG: hypothetical protein JSV20_08300, partial [Candidatus Bathyarchaeota archaeon]